ncbi:MAG: hypothetical protein JWR84_2390 [Caulobacter sp.]|nr:hypothetical protein [Caulobacter sp.]
MRLLAVAIVALGLTACGAPEPERYIVQAGTKGLVVVSDVHRADDGRNWAVIHMKNVGATDFEPATQIAVYCPARQLKSTALLVPGKPTPTKVESSWEQPRPGTVGDSMLKVICDPEVARKSVTTLSMRRIEKFWQNEVEKGESG